MLQNKSRRHRVRCRRESFIGTTESSFQERLIFRGHRPQSLQHTKAEWCCSTVHTKARGSKYCLLALMLKQTRVESIKLVTDEQCITSSLRGALMVHFVFRFFRNLISLQV